MRPVRPDRRRPRRAHGVTLIELVVSIVLVAIIFGAVVFFALPLRQAADLATRAELTDIADNALQRIGREVRLALPNSVRVDGTKQYLEFVPVRTAGRYRADSGGANANTCPAEGGFTAPDADQLSFDTGADTCFKSIGTLANADTVTASDYLVLNNYGSGFSGQDAYATSGTLNRRQMDAVDYTTEATRARVSFTSATQFDRTLHDSAGKRFYIVTQPVSYACAGGTITRYAGYGFNASQPTSFGSGDRIADNVTACSFDYLASVAPQVGLLTLRLTLEKTVSGGQAEKVYLYHAVHVSNVP